MKILILKRPKPPPAPTTLAQVIAALPNVSGLSKTRCRDLISAGSSFARLAGRSAHDIPTEPAQLRALIQRLHHVQGRISKKRLANLKADLAAALKAVGVLPDDAQAQISTAWECFLAKATSPHHRYFVARFARFCSAYNIAPEAVDDAVLARFRHHLEARLITADPDKIARETAKNFNAIVKRAGLPYPLLTARQGERYVSTPLEAYPQSLQKDIERYLRHLEKPSLFSAEGPDKPLRPISIRNIKAHLRQTLDAAVLAGHPRERFKTLADLIDVDLLKVVAKVIIARAEGRVPASLSNILATLQAIARYHVPDSQDAFKRIAAAKQMIKDQLGLSKPTMSQKSQRRLDPFQSPENVALVVQLPGRLMKRAKRDPDTQRAALDAMAAAAISFLLACPALRMANLADLKRGEDLTRIAKGKNVSFVVHVAPDKTKGRQAIDARIEAPLSTIIDQYLTDFRHQLAADPEDWLFPKRSGGPRSPAHLGGFITKTIKDETGLVMNPHLFRHLSALLYLQERPGEYESVRRLLAHAKIDTTTSFYAPLSSKAASQRYHEVLDKYRRDR